MFAMDIHSPVHALDFQLFREKQIRVYMKRDDMIHPFISGNKWRKLKYTLQAARAQNRTHLVTFGGAWSNHLLATACAGARFGFKTTAFVRGEAVSNFQLSLCRLFGMELRFVDRSAYRDKYALFDQYYGENEQAYCIDEGGYSVEGARGCAELFDELDQQYDHICCACGTGTTLAGLYLGKTARGIPGQLHGIPVLAGGGFIRKSVEDLLQQPLGDDIVLHTDYHFGGYAKTSPQLNAFIHQFCRRTGILIEPVYTGKLCYGVFDLARQGYFQPGTSILLIHTGGLTGMAGLHDRLEHRHTE
ncbi:1-aminocyclopropane-1-carboxylate deaminase [Parapedobacter composti]|uniref:1-aminocyclopropane-1-carboxylate deaminase n=2 Tax=Parapedobacter composti TaxID=623281 RepID=A0A1I1GEA1_9SPHI|nr:1-aminocyclopropane-1-carboxylate deaminase [Parapedobacter composti]